MAQGGEGSLLAMIVDTDTATGLLLTGVGQVDIRKRANFLIVDDSEPGSAAPALLATAALRCLLRLPACCACLPAAPACLLRPLGCLPAYFVVLQAASLGAAAGGAA